MLEGKSATCPSSFQLPHHHHVICLVITEPDPPLSLCLVVAPPPTKRCEEKKNNNGGGGGVRLHNMAALLSTAATAATTGAAFSPRRRGPRHAAPARRRHQSTPRGIGFDLGESSADKLRPDEEARELIDDAASLLMVQDCMRGETAQAFLMLLTQISMKASSTKVLQAYGNFFRAQVANGADTFLDHILDEVINGGGGATSPPLISHAHIRSRLTREATFTEVVELQCTCGGCSNRTWER